MPTPRKHLNPLAAAIGLAACLALTGRAQLPAPASPTATAPMQLEAPASGSMPMPPMPGGPPAAAPAQPLLPPAPAAQPSAAEQPAPPELQPGTQRVIPETLTPAIRDPFWPIGYAPRTPEEIEASRQRGTAGIPPTAPRWKDARESLRIGGSAKGPRGYTALINNRLVTAGDFITHEFDGKIYRWKVEAISAHDISFIPLDWMTAEGSTPNTGKDRP